MSVESIFPAVTRLTLTRFRSYDTLSLRLDPRPVAITGPNGAGKTNLLEALSFLAPGRGLRRASLAEIQYAGPAGDSGGEAPQPWAIAVTLETPLGPLDIGIGRADTGSDRRVLRIDGTPRKQQTDLGDLLVVQWLTPQMDRLFQDGASGRRRFFDRMVYGIDPAHAARLTAYDHAMRERNRLLKDSRATGRRLDPAWLAALEGTMAETGAAITVARQAALAQLQAAVELGIGPFPAADLALDPGLEGHGTDAATMHQHLAERLAERRRIDAEAGGATEGPHRADLRVWHRAKGVAAERCSTGEQKALLIALQLANARLIKQRRGSPPLLLLDEIAAHLDARRRAALYDELEALGGQAWMTGTDPMLFDAWGARAQYIGVDDGVVRQIC